MSLVFKFKPTGFAANKYGKTLSRLKLQERRNLTVFKFFGIEKFTF